MHTKPSTCAIIQIQENKKKYKRKTHKAEKEGGTKVRTCYIYVFCKNKRLVLKAFACNSVQMWTLHSNLHGAICWYETQRASKTSRSFKQVAANGNEKPGGRKENTSKPSTRATDDLRWASTIANAEKRWLFMVFLGVSFALTTIGTLFKLPHYQVITKCSEIINWETFSWYPLLVGIKICTYGSGLRARILALE
jgi:hypothetical protein